MSKRRGALLALAKELAKAERSEKTELERIERLNRRRAVLIDPDGTVQDAPVDNEPNEEDMVPDLQDDELSSDDGEL